MSDLPVAQATPVNNGSSVQVTAPSDLQEGYKLQVSVNGKDQEVTVPAGGVKEGQSFTAQVQEQAAGDEKIHNIPTGQWRDGLCDCLKHGCCHAMCWLGCCFEVVVTGQVMTRMSLNWIGGPGQRPSVSNTCYVVTGIMVGFIFLEAIFSIVMDAVSCWGVELQWNEAAQEFLYTCPDGSTIDGNSTFSTLRSIISILGTIFFVYKLVIVCQTRRAIREKYDIPPGCCGPLNDCCVSYWCLGCATCQMARHTNDYNQYDVACCSNDCFNKRGQKEIVPEIV